MTSLKIEKIDTNKHKIKQRALMEAGVIPLHPSISLFSGSAGSGKTNLIVNLLKNPSMYGKSFELMPPNAKEPHGYFDAVFLMLNSSDDLFESLTEDDTIKPQHICHRPSPEDVQRILDEQKSIIEALKGQLHLAPKILVIFDDCVSNQALLRSEPFLRLMTANRHYNSSVFVTAQYINLVPRSIRLQASFTFVFKCNRQELSVLSEQYCPPSMSKQEFGEIVQDATRDGETTNNFLLIVKRAPEDQRFRKNLDSFITLKRHGYRPKIKPPSKKEIDDLDFDIDKVTKTIEQEYKEPPPFNPDLPDMIETHKASSNRGRGRPQGSKTQVLHKTANLPAGVPRRRVRNMGKQIFGNQGES